MRRARGAGRRGGARVSAPDLSVIVVTWNTRDLARTCLQRVRERAGDLDVEIIAFDNASTDGTPDALRAAFPDVRVVASPANLGFPAANNAALAEARGRHVLFLNPDTEVGEGTLAACVAELDRDPELGAVGCRLEHADGRVQYECGRRAYRLHHLLWEAAYLHVLFPRSRLFAHQLMGAWDHRDRRDVEALSGAFLMVRSEVARALGGLPEDVFMYHEDLAFCLRVERTGWRLRCLGDVATVHHGGASASRSPSRLELLEGEVRVRLIRERSGAWAGALARFLFAVREAVRLGIAVAVRIAPGAAAARRRYPAVSDLGKHARLLLWTVAPGVALRGVPGQEGSP